MVSVYPASFGGSRGVQAHTSSPQGLGDNSHSVNGWASEAAEC
jgi:hypothetical protein